MSLASFLAALPKAELHLHLEGAIAPATLLRLAEQRRIALPATDEQSLRDWFRFRDFEHFVEVYSPLALRDPEDFRLAAEGLLATLSRSASSTASALHDRHPRGQRREPGDC